MVKQHPEMILGIGVYGFGYIYSKEESAWIIMVFGLIIFAAGFIRPNTVSMTTVKSDPTHIMNISCTTRATMQEAPPFIE